MSIINEMKKLVGRSSLFVLDKDYDVLNKRKRGGDKVKIGQGGTLDPLADGVLGSCYSKAKPTIFS